MSVPFFDLRGQHLELRSELSAAVGRVLDSQQFILGPEVEAFEKEIAGYVSTKFAVACASAQMRYCLH